MPEAHGGPINATSRYCAAIWHCHGQCMHATARAEHARSAGLPHAQPTSEQASARLSLARMESGNLRRRRARQADHVPSARRRLHTLCAWRPG